ncbi:MAG: WXG100 family type VII secretion target [Sciscionella sp.]
MGGEANFGDIAGLRQLTSVTKNAAPEFQTAGHVLDTQVHDLTSDAWRGQAARAFSAAWGKDSAGARAVSESLSHISGTVNRLASALEEAKKQCASRPHRSWSRWWWHSIRARRERAQRP